MATKIFWVLLMIFLNMIRRSHVSSNPVHSNVSPDARDFLQKYGYFVPPDPKAGQLLSEAQLVVSLKKLQRFAGLKETGTLDAETLKLIETPRCGMSDIAESDAAKRKKRYALQGSTWKKRHLTWKLMNLGNDGLSVDQTRNVIKKALKMWQDKSTLTFEEKDIQEPDIKLYFVRGYHKDAYPFDGEGGTLAHAFYPHNNQGISGDVHYDDDEKFTIGTKEGKNFLWVTVHELGHSIGLEHSSVKGAIMYPWYQGYKGDDFELHQDDITGIQTLYDAPNEDNAGTTPIPPLTKEVKTSAPSPRVCTDRIEAIFLGRDKKTYVINKDKVYVLSADVPVLEKGPVPVSKMFPGVDHVDAAFRRQSDRRLIFFSKDKFYEVENFKLFRGPRKITDGFSGLPKGFADVDAAFVWPRNNKLYVFKGSVYYRFTNRGYGYLLDYGYPLKISQAWGRVPNNVDAVFAWDNKKTYFFKGSKYYRLDDRRIKVVDGYPRSIDKVWMNCLGSLSNDNNSASSSRSSMVLFIMTGIITFLWIR